VYSAPKDNQNKPMDTFLVQPPTNEINPELVV
jgi:hypothetical protein